MVLLAMLAGCMPGEGEANRLERPAIAVYSAGAGRVFVLHQQAQGPGQPVGTRIARMNLDGQVERRNWRQGFGPNAALAAQGNTLYVSDGSELWQFDARSGDELAHVTVDHAQLSDVAVDPHGLVHVLDQRKARVLRVVGERAVNLPLPPRTTPIAILHSADALWILLAGQGRDETILLRRSFADDERLCRLSPVSGRSVLVDLERNRIGLFDPKTQRLRRFDQDCRELLHWRIAAGPVRFAQLPGDRLAIPEPERDRVNVMATPDRLLADAPGQFR